jgi:hypothetical protein
MFNVSSKAMGVFLLAVVSASIACGGGSSTVSTTDPAPTNAPVPQFAHVFLIVEENHSYADVVGNPGMPYFNSLITKYGLATQYFANVHPSLPNYFMLTTGATIAPDDTFSATVTQNNVLRALISAGKTWKCYAESLPAAGYLGLNVGAYIRDHNPCTYFSDVINSSTQASNVVPFTHFASDTTNTTLPDYGLIIPNGQNDGHDCPPGMSVCNDSDKLVNMDLWLKNNLGPFLSSPAFANSLVILTFDEGQPTDLAHGGGRVSTLIISPKSKVGYKSTTFYQHESTLRLMMKVLGVTDFPGASASAPDMGEFFQ